jgi:hypothetical protein
LKPPPSWREHFPRRPKRVTVEEPQRQEANVALHRFDEDAAKGAVNPKRESHNPPRGEKAMNIREYGSFILWISLPLALLVAIAASAGLFWAPTYAQEKPLWAATGIGGDAVNLLVVVPLLVASALLARKGLVPACLIWIGTLIFLLYNFFIYAMAVHFNAMFPVYCAVLSLIFFGLVGFLPGLSFCELSSRYGQRAPVKTTAAALFLIALIFGAQWLREIIPALGSGKAPKGVAELGLLTNPVHVLDLSFVLPANVIVAILLLRRKPVAFTIAPALLVFSTLMPVALVGMIVAMIFKGLSKDYAPAAIFAVMAAALAVLLARYLRTPNAGQDLPAPGS